LRLGPPQLVSNHHQQSTNYPQQHQREPQSVQASDFSTASQGPALTQPRHKPPRYLGISLLARGRPTIALARRDLRHGVMYGADKIPDTWFDKVPGGFYKSKDGKTVKVTSKDGGGLSTTGSRAGGKNRRRSTGERRRGHPAYDDYYDADGNHKSARRREGGVRDSYDGGVDDDYYSGDDHRRRRNHSSTRRRKSVDDDRYGYHDGSGREQRYDSVYGDARQHDARPTYPASHGQPYSNQYPYAAVKDVGAAAAAGMNGVRSPPYPQPQPNSASLLSPPSSSTVRSGLINGYVPYSNIYGQPQGQQQSLSQQFSPPPSESFRGSAQPSPYNQMGPTVAPQQYQQNPNAQEAAAVAGAAGAVAGVATQDQSGSFYDRGYDPRYDDRYQEPTYNPRYDDRYRYDDRGRPYDSQSPRRHRSTRRGRSPSHDSYVREDRKSRSQRREDERRTKSTGETRGKSMNRIKEQIDKNFDVSQKGLGYGLVGALAGGLAGSELGKGPIPTAIGAALGGGLANAFEARERYVPPGYHPAPGYPSPPVTVDPRRPLNAQLMMGRGRDADRAASSEPRRKNQPGVKRDARAVNGYYSD
ncbi:sarcoplasmic reticulum histidine-rich calcium-binding protein-like, partial [Teratosphaeria destructans]